MTNCYNFVVFKKTGWILTSEFILKIWTSRRNSNTLKNSEYFPNIGATIMKDLCKKSQQACFQEAWPRTPALFWHFFGMFLFQELLCRAGRRPVGPHRAWGTCCLTYEVTDGHVLHHCLSTQNGGGRSFRAIPLTLLQILELADMPITADFTDVNFQWCLRFKTLWNPLLHVFLPLIFLQTYKHLLTKY